MPREVQDQEGTTWNLVQAYAGLKSDNEEKKEAASVEGESDKVHVVATPTGGAQTVRLQLQSDWEDAIADDELLREIERQS